MERVLRWKRELEHEIAAFVRSSSGSFNNALPLQAKVQNRKVSEMGEKFACKGFSGLTNTEMPGVGASFICLNFSHKDARNEIVNHEHKPFRVPWAIVWEPLQTFFQPGVTFYR